MLSLWAVDATGPWRGAFDIAQRQFPAPVDGGGKLVWRLPVELRVRPTSIVVEPPFDQAVPSKGQ